MYISTFLLIAPSYRLELWFVRYGSPLSTRMLSWCGVFGLFLEIGYGVGNVCSSEGWWSGLFHASEYDVADYAIEVDAEFALFKRWLFEETEDSWLEYQ